MDFQGIRIEAARKEYLALINPAFITSLAIWKTTKQS